MKGIILAGGTGSRFFPITKAVNKHLLPIYNKPVIYHPIATLMLAGIKDILIIVNPNDITSFKKILKNGEDWGISIQYEIQEKPKGLAEAFIIGEKFIGNDSVVLMLGDNVLYKDSLQSLLKNSIKNNDGATIFLSHINDPKSFGIAEINECGNVISIEEKPENPKSNLAVIGLYIYDNDVIEIAKNIKPSARGELEITDINNEYLKNKKLNSVQIGRGAFWLDVGTPNNLLQASEFMSIIEKRQNLEIANLNEISLLIK